MLISKFMAMIAPHDCLVCGAEDSLLCAWCAPEALPPVPARCYRCGALSRDSKTCNGCRRSGHLGNVWVATEHVDVAKELVARLKFSRAQAAVYPMTDAMRAVLPFLHPETIITPVPTAAARVRMRGYDQAELLARSLATSINLPTGRLLWRMGVSRQVGASRIQRQAHMAAAFRPRRTDRIIGARILLVDDVVTTGATLEAAARCLREAGAKRVDAVVFAQQVKR